MRRTLSLVWLLITVASATAAAQAHARLGARLQLNAAAPPDLVVHVSDLLDDPRWRDALASAFPVRLHWRVVLWQSHFPADRQLRPIEWDDVLQHVPVIDVYTFEERTTIGKKVTTFHTLDSLAALTGAEARILTSPNLSPGRWYYTVDLRISADAPANQSGDGDPSPLSQLLQRVILGDPHEDLPTARTVTFTVPGR